MYFLLNLSHYVKSYGHFCQILAFFTMPAHQIWSCHVTQEANFKKIYFFLILHLILRKVTKFFSRKAIYFRSYQPKSSVWGWKTHPSDFRVKIKTTKVSLSRPGATLPFSPLTEWSLGDSTRSHWTVKLQKRPSHLQGKAELPNQDPAYLCSTIANPDSLNSKQAVPFLLKAKNNTLALDLSQ